MEETRSLEDRVSHLMPLRPEDRPVLSRLGSALLDSNFHNPPGTKLTRVGKQVLERLEKVGLIARHPEDGGWVMTDAGL